MFGGYGNDLVVSNGGGGELYGGTGADTIYGSYGLQDEIYGGSGNDRIHAHDGKYDYVDCGLYASATSTAADYDTADVDKGLDTIIDCENAY